jgi:glycerol-3-phosphate dehydrogenase
VAADAVAREVAPALCGRGATAVAPLGGNSRERFDALLSSAPQMAAEARLEPAAAEALARDYGLLAPAVLALLPERPPAGLGRLEAAQIAFAVRHEMARRLPDLLFVSTHWGFSRRWTEAELGPFAQAMGSALGWDQARAAAEIRLALHASAPTAFSPERE